MKFSETTQADRNAMTPEEWSTVPPEEKRSCYDCAYLQSHITWWCKNKEAIKARGTSIPGVCLCPYWSKVTTTTFTLPVRRTLQEWLRDCFFRL